MKELNPTDAPTWIVRCSCHPSMSGKLSGFIASFTRLLECEESWQQVHGTEMVDDDGDELDQPSARDAFEKNLGFGGRAKEIVGQKLGGKLSSTYHTIGNTVKRARDKVKSARTTFRSKAQTKLMPSDDDLNNMWRYMFRSVEFRQRNPQGREAPGSMNGGGVSSPFRGCKSAPGGSLLGLFALYAPLANLHNGGIGGIAVIWKELVLELRDCWNTLDIPDNVEFAHGPSMNNCLILQKIQMICCCIQRQKDRNRLVEQSAAQHRGGDDDDEGSGISDDDSSDCSDFQSADEEVTDYPPVDVKSPATAPAAATAAAAAATAPAAATAAAAAATPAAGIKSVSPMLRLLRTNVPLNVPITQEEAPMTEDMVEARSQQMTAMGTSELAVQKRLEMQTLGLRSDMMAFKAANPGCVIADFVRWHSPRDWIGTAVVGEDGGSGERVAGVDVEGSASSPIEDSMLHPIEDSSMWPGRLSDRMLSTDNIWHITWKDAQPRPVSKQRVLFDCAKEAEKALAYLETVEPRQVIWQLHAPLLESAFAVVSEQVAMYTSPTGAAVVVPTGTGAAASTGGSAGGSGGGGSSTSSGCAAEPESILHVALQQLRDACSQFGNCFDADLTRIEDIIERFLHVESLLAQMESLLHIIERINDELPEGEQIAQAAQQQLAGRMLNEQEHLVLTAPERTIVAQMFQIDAEALPGRKKPAAARASSDPFDDSISDSIQTTREFLFRLVSARPSRSSRPAAHRMYCLLSEDSFRVSGATSTDELFQ
jgi:Rab3 GTPase-activating protein catalytic subunit